MSEDVTKALADLKAMIDELSDDTKTPEEVAELENKIQTQLNNLLPKIENTANKEEFAKLKKQFANLQQIMLDDAVKKFQYQKSKL